MPAQFAQRPAIAVEIRVGNPHRQFRPRLAQRIARIGQRDAPFRVRFWFQPAAQVEGARLACIDAQRIGRGFHHRQTDIAQLARAIHRDQGAEHIPLPLEPVAGCEGGAEMHAIGIGIVQVIRREPAVEQHHGRGLARNGMVGEIAAHQIVAVADTRRHHVVGGEHQARILDRAHAKNRDARPDRERRPAKRRDLHMVQLPCILRELERRDIGVQIEIEIFDALQVFGIAFTEMGRQRAAAHFRKLEKGGVNAAIAEGKRRVAGPAAPDFRLVIDRWSRLDQALCPRVIGFQRLASERPARMGKPAPLLEIDFVQRPAPAAPMIGAAAKKAQPRTVQRQIMHAGFRPVVKGLGRGIEFHTAAFQQRHARFGIGQCDRQRDSGGAAADQQNIGVDGRACRNGAGIDECGQCSVLSTQAIRHGRCGARGDWEKLPPPAVFCLVEKY